VEVLDIPLGGEVLMGQIVAHVVNAKTAAESDSLEEQLLSAQERVANLEALVASAQLEATRASAEASAAQANVERTRNAAERQELLFKEGVAPRNAAEQARKEATTASSEFALLREAARTAGQRAGTVAADLTAAQKSIDSLNKMLQDAAEDLRQGEVVSPIDGVLVGVRYLPGDAVPKDTKDLLYVAPSALRLSVALEPDPVSAQQLALLPPEGAVVEIVLSGHPDLPLAGRLIKTTDGKWQALLDLTEPTWKPGDQATVKVRVPRQ
jgi:multidrug resistance efflux pump